MSPRPPRAAAAVASPVPRAASKERWIETNEVEQKHKPAAAVQGRAEGGAFDSGSGQESNQPPCSLSVAFRLHLHQLRALYRSTQAGQAGTQRHRQRHRKKRESKKTEKRGTRSKCNERMGMDSNERKRRSSEETRKESGWRRWRRQRRMYRLAAATSASHNARTSGLGNSSLAIEPRELCGNLGKRSADFLTAWLYAGNCYFKVPYRSGGIACTSLETDAHIVYRPLAAVMAAALAVYRPELADVPAVTPPTVYLHVFLDLAITVAVVAAR